MKPRINPPNLISFGRLLVTPILFALILRSEPATDAAALLLFALAAVSDYVDGWLARKRGWVTELGIYLDPAADKLLLAATFLPFFLITGSPGAERTIPYWTSLPLWVLVVVLGREVVVTGLAFTARRQGATVPAERMGKWKSAVEDLFSGALLLLWVLERWVGRSASYESALEETLREVGAPALRMLVAILLGASVILALVSMVTYLPHLRRRLRQDGE